MEENILHIGKIIEKWIEFQMDKKDMMDKVPSVSYITDELLSYNGIKSILLGLDGQTLIRSIFTSYNLLIGYDDISALKKSKTISDINVIERESEPYNIKQECDECVGDGDVKCEGCDNEGNVDCGGCNGESYLKCPECDGSNEDCNYCGGGGEVYCDECNGKGTELCSECYGNGKIRCQECNGSGEVESYDEYIDVSYYSIITQNEDLVNEINNNLDSDDMIKNFDEIIDKYQGEILMLDTIRDTINFDKEWGVDGGDNEYKLENIISPYYRFTIKNNNITTIY